MKTTAPKTIPADIADAELSALVGEHCAGFIRADGLWHSPEFVNPPRCLSDEIPLFASSVDAVLPLVGRYEVDAYPLDDGEESEIPPFVEVCIFNPHPHKASAPTLARAICFCLLKSKGIQITE